LIKKCNGRDSKFGVGLEKERLWGNRGISRAQRQAVVQITKGVELRPPRAKKQVPKKGKKWAGGSEKPANKNREKQENCWTKETPFTKKGGRGGGLRGKKNLDIAVFPGARPASPGPDGQRD